MSYPKTLYLFRKWAAAMEKNATVDTPRYEGTKTPKRQTPRKRGRRLRRKRRSMEE